MSTSAALSIEADPFTERSRPRLRRDLEFTQRRVGEAVEVIVCDPRTGSYFRAGELEAALFALLDGEKPLDAVAAHLTRQFPDLVPEEVPAFVAHLDRLGFLEGSAAVGARPRTPLYRRLLYAQVRLANPDRLFGRLLPYVGWLYRPAGWAAVALLFLVAGAFAAGSQEALASQVTAPHGPGFWLRIWIGLILIGTIHEFGHGLTCKYFGGRSDGIGLLWIYGLPCFYCDVSGAWMLPRKSQRLWVGVAGLYYQFIAGGIALLIWRVLEPGSLASDLLLAMVLSCGFFSLLNLNPLLKLDGYYLLSDWLEIPNLRERAFKALGQSLARFWFGADREGVASVAEAPSLRERRICLRYATATALFLAWLLPGLLWHTARYFTGRLGGTGALLFLMLAGLTFGTPVVSASVALGRRLARWQEIPMMGQRRLLMGGTLGFALLASAVIPSELHLTSPCRLEASVRGAVRARAAGQVAELLVREGQRVARGESVGRLSTFGREQKLAELRAQLTAVQAEMTALETQLHGPALAESRVRPGVATTITGGTAAHEERGEPPGFAQGASTVAERRAGATHADLYAVRSRLAEARAAVEAQRRVAARLRADAERTGRRNPPPVVAAARELWHQRTAERDLAQRDLQRLRRLLAGGHVPPQQVDAARSHCETATRLAGEALQGVKATEKSLREAADDAAAELAWRRAALATAQEVTRVEMLTRRAQFVVKQQAAAQLAAQIAVLTDEVQRSTLVAPCDGVVTTSRVEERVGASFAEGGAVLEVADPRALFTRIFVNERDLGAVRVGQPVMLRIAAFPECLYRAQVSEIAPQAVCSGSEAFPTNIVEVHVQLDNLKGQLRPGMSGRAKINCGRCPVGGILLRRLHRYLRTEVWSWL